MTPRDDDEPLCPDCAGSGEGMHDGTRCRSCRGSGVDQSDRWTDDDDACERHNRWLDISRGCE